MPHRLSPPLRVVGSTPFVWLIYGPLREALALAIAYGGAMLIRPASPRLHIAGLLNSGAIVVVIACALLGYLMCALVIDRISSLWWAHVKFMEATISLGRSTATTFALVATIAAATSLSLHRWAALPARIEFLNRAAFALIVGAAFLYLMLGASPYVVWRA